MDVKRDSSHGKPNQFANPLEDVIMPAGWFLLFHNLRMKISDTIHFLSLALLLAGIGHSASHEQIESELLSTTVATAFPRVIETTWRPSGARLYGQKQALDEVEINGDIHQPQVTFHRVSGCRVGYKLDFPALEIDLAVEISVAANALNLEITQINERGSSRVETLAFPNHSLVSIRSNQPGAAIATALATGEWNQIVEQFSTLVDKAPDPQPVPQTYVVIHTDELAAALDNNSLLYERARTQTTEHEGFKQFALWNAPWIYRGLDGEVIALPRSSVLFADDRNQDGRVDWQDGAIALREHLREHLPEPLGAEIIRDSFAYISFNAGSIAHAPFLRALEDAKQLALMTDGFGQMIQFKGYQSEGHDAAHPDCAGNYNRRAGGLEDLLTFLQHAPEYNLYPGVHINVSESYPEAQNFSDDILRIPYEAGWSWYDSALKMDYHKDILSGNLYRRLDQMHQELPGLRWIYVDVYGGHYGNDPWAAHKLATKLNDNGWMVSTEYFGPMERQVAWVHHLYAVSDSRLVRFLKNHTSDTFQQHPLLKGARQHGIGGWENNYNFNSTVAAFYQDNLPTKYMQHFPILRWQEHRIDLEGGVHVENHDGWKLFRNGQLLADEHALLIPWEPTAPNKAYHWNRRGGSTTWSLPQEWSAKDSLILYRLGRLGREKVTDLPVSDGTITIDAKANTAYVVYPEEPEPMRVVWGEGGPIRDPGFTSGTFDAWQRESSTDPVSIEIDASANALLVVNAEKNNAAGATVSQKIEGLKSGTHSASVWVEVDGGREAWIGIQLPGEEMAINWVDRTDSIRSEGRLKFKGTRFQRMAVIFDVPQGETEAVIFLGAKAGTPASTARFDDVRLTRLPGRTPQGTHLLFEDFENIDEQWGPFVSAGDTDHVHLSETNPGITDDTINGNFSLKNLNEGTRGEIYRTVQATLKLKPNTTYRLGFDYINRDANFHVAVKTSIGGADATALDEAIPSGTGQFSASFTTGDFPDYYVAFQTEGSQGRMFVIDDFFVDKL